MKLSPDLKEFIALLNAHRVEYLIAGAYALALHGCPRYTGDVDIFVRTGEVNAQRLEAAVHEFGFASTGLTAADFQEPDCVIQLGHVPNRVDILTSLTGLDFERAWQERLPGKLDGVPVYFLSKACFIKNKQATGRPQDIADIARLTGTTQTKP